MTTFDSVGSSQRSSRNRRNQTPDAAAHYPSCGPCMEALESRVLLDGVADWTVMVYMAADNGRQDVAMANINAMERNQPQRGDTSTDRKRPALRFMSPRWGLIV